MAVSLFKIGAGRRAKTKLDDQAAQAPDGKKKKSAAASKLPARRHQSLLTVCDCSENDGRYARAGFA
ncbi:hypothetical protein BVRB_037450 [Beta vulgaris subsp. vulgaris]|uniref:Uncharacterized protein n=1 Tax=Beta vulgaris subsp. vulgaris TaxID=3555 RepID=A0A0J7YQ67_BETVV|nr:hypothetical protein BVRB_037450 [Beta vulgaris subsp. vulgaris]